MDNSKKQNKLLELAAKITDNKVCLDLAEQATQLVFGSGNPDADIVFIGEAPGKKEDETGKPFVGAAGRFLDEMLQSINLGRADVYITNIVKYRPPNNRDPLPAEKEAFLPYLQDQLEIIQPKLLVTLGRHSTNCFLPDLQISKAHGKPVRLKVNSSIFCDDNEVGGPGVDGVQEANEKRPSSTSGTVSESHRMATQQSATKLDSVTNKVSEQDERAWTILPLYHPAAALYNGAMRQTLLDDFAAIPTILQKIK